jgi:hypothetical protein
MTPAAFPGNGNLAGLTLRAFAKGAAQGAPQA